MYIDARRLENGTQIEGGLCIFRAGAAGISMALDRIHTPCEVSLLEGEGSRGAGGYATGTGALGMPRLILDWQLSSLDNRSIRRFYTILDNQVGRSAVGRVRLMDWTRSEEDTSWLSILGGAGIIWYHPDA